jgi:hypothetical protein
VKSLRRLAEIWACSENASARDVAVSGFSEGGYLMSVFLACREGRGIDLLMRETESTAV